MFDKQIYLCWFFIGYPFWSFLSPKEVVKTICLSVCVTLCSHKATVQVPSIGPILFKFVQNLFLDHERWTSSYFETFKKYLFFWPNILIFPKRFIVLGRKFKCSRCFDYYNLLTFPGCCFCNTLFEFKYNFI